MTITTNNPESEQRKRDLEEILPRVDSLPIIDPRSPDEIIGYDENGLPESSGA